MRQSVFIPKGVESEEINHSAHVMDARKAWSFLPIGHRIFGPLLERIDIGKRRILMQ